jgi:hypothetical protein
MKTKSKEEYFAVARYIAFMIEQTRKKMMSEVTKETLEWANKPFDIVTNEKGNVGFIQEVSVNDCQSTPESQISYAVNWMVGDNYKHAWFDHDELTVHGNILIKIAECACHPMGHNDSSVQKLFNAMDRD